MRPRLARLQRDGESFLGAASAIFLAILLQYALPDRVSHYQRWVFPTVAAVLLIVIVVGHRGRIAQQSALLRGLTLLTIVIMSLANSVAAIRLVRDLIEGEGIRTARTLLLTGAAIWLTNVIVFALIFWMFDRGGPAARFLVKGTPPDLLFPQQSTPEETAPVGARLLRLLLHVVHQRDGVQPDRRHAPLAVGQVRDAGRVSRVARARGPRRRPRGQHPRLNVAIPASS